MNGMTITEKILAAHAGRERVVPGETVQVQVDLALANDVTGPLAIESFLRIGVPDVFDREKLVLVADHFTPNKDVDAARHCKIIRDFARVTPTCMSYARMAASTGKACSGSPRHSNSKTWRSSSA